MNIDLITFIILNQLQFKSNFKMNQAEAGKKPTQNPSRSQLDL